MSSTLIMQPASRAASRAAYRSIAPNAAMAGEKSAQAQVHGVDVAVPAFATALPAAVRTRGDVAPLPRGIPV